ncbi:MAG: hypothetical protein HOV81_41025 [Kofleriaceae bacterium]|nr:hypothetical protein [Kofleriaceae bacterium]
MTAYALVKLAHVMIAVLAMGLVTAGAILSRAASGIPPTALRPVVRLAMVGILLMLASGVLLDYLLAGALHAATWFRIGMAWTVAAGVAIGYSLRVMARATVDSERARRRLQIASWVAFVCIAATAAVMVRKP